MPLLEPLFEVIVNVLIDADWAPPSCEKLRPHSWSRRRIRSRAGRQSAKARSLMTLGAATDIEQIVPVERPSSVMTSKAIVAR